MINIRQSFRKQSTSKQIVIIVVGIFTLVLILASIEKMLVYDSVQVAQLEKPQEFFKSSEKYSLNQTAILVKQLIFSTIDFRAAFMVSLVNSIKYSKNHPASILDQDMSTIFTNQSLKTNCIIPQPNSIFDCSWDIYTKFIIEEEWQMQIQRQTRRLTFIYQNLVNRSDVMIKTISHKTNLENHTIDEITKKMKFNQEGYLIVSNFYVVPNGKQNQSLVSFQTKIQFLKDNYSILIQIETYGTQFTTPLSKILYSDQINVAILAPKINDTFQLIASSRPLEQGIDFHCMLHEGFREKQLSKTLSISSYTIPFSSYHRLGELNYANQQLENQVYKIVVYTFNMNKQIKDKIFDGINNLRANLRELSILFLVMIIAIGLMTICIAYADMMKNFKVYTEMIRKYMQEPEKFNNYVNCKNQKVFPLLRNNSFLRMLNFVIKMIEWKKKEFKRKTNNHMNDQFPLNTFDERFQDSQQLKDLLRLEQIYRKLEKYQKPSMQQPSKTKAKRMK